jgi:hypothetical protein
MGMLARISSHAKKDSVLMQCSRLPFWLNAKVTISVVAVRRLVTRIFRYLSQASVDSDPHPWMNYWWAATYFIDALLVSQIVV